MNWEIYGKIKASAIRKKILVVLSEKPLSPKEIHEKTGASFPQVSRNISELTKLGLITCLNPNIRKGKMYKITSFGEEILKAHKSS